MKSSLKTLAMWLIIGIIFIVLITSILDNADTKMTYSELMTKIENAEVKTNLFFHCLSYGKESQSYRVCSNEKTSTQIELEIEAKPTNLYIKKIDKETKVPISNVTFEIKDEKGNKLQEITTNKEGIAKIENIIEQTVIVKEIKVPKDYIISNEEVNVELKWGEITNVIIENERKKEEKIPDPPKEIKEEPKLPRTGF